MELLTWLLNTLHGMLVGSGTALGIAPLAPNEAAVAAKRAALPTSGDSTKDAKGLSSKVQSSPIDFIM